MPLETLFRRHLGRFRVWSAMKAGIRNMRRHVFAFRVNLIDPLDFKLRCIHVNLPPDLIHQIHRMAKAQHASVNDVFLAVIGEARWATIRGECYCRKRRHGRRRNRVGLGTIVDIRDASAQPWHNVFGLYLSSQHHRAESSREVAADAPSGRQISSATKRIKRKFGSVRSYWGLVTARFWWETYGDAKWKSQMFHKNVPVTAGISNVNLTGSGMDEPVARWIGRRPGSGGLHPHQPSRGFAAPAAGLYADHFGQPAKPVRDVSHHRL